MKEKEGFLLRYRNFIYLAALLIIAVWLGLYFFNNIGHGIDIAQKALSSINEKVTIEEFNLEGAGRLGLSSP